MSHPWIKFVRPSPLPAHPPTFGGHESPLMDALRGSVIHRLMARDGIEMSAMEALILTMQRRFQ